MPKHVSGGICESCSDKLAVAHPDLAKWFLDKVKPKFPAAHISWSYRDKNSQEQAFLDGKTKLHYPNSAHNKQPARAIDLFELDVHGQACWAWGFFRDIADCASKDIDPILWGGHWKHLGDFDHFELTDPTTN